MLHPVVPPPRLSSTSVASPAQFGDVPHPWHRLPVEVTEQILAAWQGADLPFAVRQASQVSAQWDRQLRWAQPEAYGRVQQRTLLGAIIADPQGPITPLTRQRLQHYSRLSFELVPDHDGLEMQLLGADAAQLGGLAGLLPDVLSCNVLRLRRGADLVIRWAQASTLLRPLRTLVLDRGQLRAKDFARLAAVAPLLPNLERIEVLGKVRRGLCIDVEELPRFDEVQEQTLSCAGWSGLAHLDLAGSNLNLAAMSLQDNAVLRHLDVSGNANVSELLLGPGAPRAGLQTLRLSVTDWDKDSFASLGGAPWAKSLRTLQFVGEPGRIHGLDLTGFDGLRRLDVSGQQVDYASWSLPNDTIASLNLSATHLDAYNAPEEAALARGQLWRLQLGKNYLPGMLNVLNLFAAPNLQVLDLSGCSLCDVDIVEWAVPESNKLTHLELSDNNLDGAAVHALSQKPLANLKYLGLRVRSRRGAQRLARALVSLGPLRNNWPQLHTLAIWSHQVRSPQGQEHLQQLLERECISTELPAGAELEHLQQGA